MKIEKTKNKVCILIINYINIYSKPTQMDAPKTSRPYGSIMSTNPNVVSLKHYSDEMYNRLSNNPKFLRGVSRHIIYGRNINIRYKELLVEKDKKLICRVGLLFKKDADVFFKRKLIELNPEELTYTDSYGRNILFYEHVDDEFKQELIKRFPWALKHIGRGGNIFFFPSVADCYKELLAALYPEALTFVKVRGNILFYPSVKDCYKRLLVDLFPEALKCLNDKGQHLVFCRDVDDFYKRMLIFLYPEYIRGVDDKGQNILFSEEVDDVYKRNLINIDQYSLTCIDDEGKTILFYDNVSDIYKQELLVLCPDAINWKDNKGNKPNYTYNITVTELGGTCYLCLCDYELGEKLYRSKCGHDLHYDCYTNIVNHNNTTKHKKTYKCYCEPKSEQSSSFVPTPQ